MNLTTEQLANLMWHLRRTMGEMPADGTQTLVYSGGEWIASRFDGHTWYAAESILYQAKVGLPLPKQTTETPEFDIVPVGKVAELEAKIERLTALVKDAHDEGYMSGRYPDDRGPLDCRGSWNDSKAGMKLDEECK